MMRLVSLIRSIPLAFLIGGAILMSLVPFGRSHLVEKWGMLLAGTLRRPLDWFDLILHSALPALLIARIIIEVSAHLSQK